MLQIKNISFAYQNKLVLKNINLNVGVGQNIALIGESGSGKSTLLKLTYGLYDLTYGNIFWNDIKILGPKFNLVPGISFMKYVAQDFDLMPYITVSENIGKYLSNIDRNKKQNRISELLDLVEMTEYANIKAQFLSGGQQQRVALARALALEPEILLLDEPFSQIDNFRKNSLRRNLFAYLKEKKISCIVATHDSTDALSFADQTIVLQNGEIIDSNVSKYLYDNPKNSYCASLFGEINEIKKSDILANCTNDQTILLRPHQLKIMEDGHLKVTIEESYFRGGFYLIKARYSDKTIFFENQTALVKQQIVPLVICNCNISI